MSILGIQSTLDFDVDGQRPKNWREMVLYLYPNGTAPLFALSAGFSQRSVDDPEFNWFTQDFPERRFALSANIVDGTDTSFTVVENAKQVKKGTLILVEETEEIVRVNADPTTDTSIPVTRGFSNTGALAAGVTIAGAGVNPNLLVIGSAFEEGSNAPSGVALKPVKGYNLTQIFRNTLEMTETARRTRLRTGDQVAKARLEALEAHSTEIERAFVLGRRHEDLENNKPIRTMGGINSFLPAANIHDVGADTAGVWNMEDLENFMKDLFLYGSSEKVAFSGREAELAVQRILRKNAEWEFQSGVKEFGMRVSRIISPFGELVMKSHPLFNLNASGSTGGSPYYGMASWMLCLDMKNITSVNLSGRDTQFEADLEENDLDGMKAGFLSELSIELHHPNTHRLVKGLTNGAAD